MLKNIGIIGGGKMGTNLLYYLLDMDFDLTWILHPDANIEKTQKTFNRRLSRSLEAGILDENRFKSILNRINISNTLEVLASCELVIEAIDENVESKQKLFATLDKIAPTGCIFTSNSSSIKPSLLIPSENRKERFAGLHFFYPIALKDIVEIILPPTASKETLQQLISFLKVIGRHSLILQEKDSFILNRLILQFQNQAFLLVHEKKASLHQIDRIVREHFFPIGVFEFFDSVGLDVMLASIKNYTKNDPLEAHYLPLIVQLQELVSAGRLGTKSKGGFYGEGVPDDPGNPENEEEIIYKLKASWSEAFRHFLATSALPAAELKSAMDEYFGAETPKVV
ncbi:MAG: 3-hydroxyacyl-CoA dehydrogenase family protein [Bacteroidetes bacterium]|nr:3-hydroxyacyl-CoA dehydrogenase family protein [Bacteroidota bacterium]